MNCSRDEFRQRRLYRDSERGVILGVCAGIAEYFDWPLWMVRLGTLGLGWCFPATVVVGYVIAAVVMPDRPLRYWGDGEERSFWQSRRPRS